jgi:hypothetical protein
MLSLKAVVVHNRKVVPPIKVGYEANMKEPYKNMKRLLKCIEYKKYQCQLCQDSEVVAIFLGLHQSYTKCCCLFCES